MTVTCKKFLKNFKNKDSLIKLILCACKQIGFKSEQARADADTCLVQKAIDLSIHGRVNLVAADTDILVMLLFHREKLNNITYLTSDSKSYDVWLIASTMTERQKSSLLVHAVSGCDTVSSVFGFGKVRIWKILGDEEKIPDEEKISDTIVQNFSQPDRSKEMIHRAGIKLFEVIFNKASEKTKYQSVKLMPQNNLHFRTYKLMCDKGNVQPERLPPTEGAVRQHSLRTYLQINDWRELQCTSLDPCEYGWKRGPSEDDDYEPTGSEDPIAPEKLQNLISCSCK